MAQPKDEHATINYLDWQELYETEKPFQLFSASAEADSPIQRSTNLVFKEGDLERIYDLRGAESTCSLDTQGFSFLKHKTQVRDFGRRENVEETYLSEVEELLRHEIDGIDQVYFFDWRVRLIL